MKAELRNVMVGLSMSNGDVTQASCNCAAGKNSYCNHVMALLFQLVDFRLKGLLEVPDQIACTSTARQWGYSWKQRDAKRSHYEKYD